MALIRSWVLEAWGILQGAWGIMKMNRKRMLLFLLAGTGLVCGTLPHDRQLLAGIRQQDAIAEQTGVRGVARAVSYWGDFAGFNVGVFGTLCCFSFVRRSPFFRRLTLAAVIGTLLTGGAANVLRVTTGRARPNSQLPPGFYGPSLSAKKQSFPSAHTATSFGASVPVAVALPPAGIPMLIVSGAVAWSRMENNCHHPSDLMVSMMMSCMFGVPLGLVIRRQQRVRNSRTNQENGLDPAEPGHVESFDVHVAHARDTA